MSKKPDLQTVRDRMHRLHGTTLDALRYRLSQKTGAPVGAGQWLQLLSGDPEYAWFRPMTTLLTEIDILLDENEVAEDAAQEIKKRAEALFKSTQEPFGKKFFELMPLETEILFNYHPFIESLKKL